MPFTIDSSFLDALANSNPTPGGGSAVAYAGAMAASLVMMVAQTTIGKKKYAAIQARMQEIVAEAAGYRRILEDAVSRDAASFDKLLAAYRAGKETPQSDDITKAELQVTEVPLHTAQTARNVLVLAVELATVANINAMSDACAAASLAHSTVFASLLNVRVNASQLEASLASAFLDKVNMIEEDARGLMSDLQHVIRERGTFYGNR